MQQSWQQAAQLAALHRRPPYLHWPPAQRRTALQLRDDLLAIKLVKILRKANQLKPRLQENLQDQTAQRANQLAQAADVVVQQYGQDWEKLNDGLGNLAEVSNELRHLDDKAGPLVEALEDLYVAAVEIELEADQQDYPEDHDVYKLVPEIEKIFNMELG